MRLYITALWESCTSALRWWKAELESGCRLDHLLAASSLSAHPLLRSKSLPLVSYNMSGKKGFKFFQRKLVLLNETNAHSQRYSHHFTKSICFFQHFFHKDLVSDEVKVCSISQILNAMLHVRSLKHIYIHTHPKSCKSMFFLIIYNSSQGYVETNQLNEYLLIETAGKHTISLPRLMRWTEN